MTRIRTCETTAKNVVNIFMYFWLLSPFVLSKSFSFVYVVPTEKNGTYKVFSLDFLCPVLLAELVSFHCFIVPKLIYSMVFL